MKILIIANCYPNKNSPFRGIFSHRAVKALTNLGAECHVIQPINWFPPFNLHRFHPYWKKGKSQMEEIFDEFEGVKIHHPRMFVKMPSRFFRNDTYETRMADSIINYVTNNKVLKNPDLIWAHFLVPDGYSAIRVKKKLNIPLATYILGDDVHAWPENNVVIQKQLIEVFNEADLLFANSRRLGEDAKRWMPEDNIKEVETVYHGVEHQKFFPIKDAGERTELKIKLNLNPEKKHLICVATPVKLKGWLELLDSIKLLKNKLLNWELVAVAPVRTYADGLDLITESRARGIEDLINFRGQVDPNDLPYLLRACDAFVLPSYNEGMANAVLEGMATGLPVIATDVGGHSEVIENEINGILIPPKSVKDLAAAIEKIILNDELRKKLGENSRRKMLDLGDYEKNGKRIISLFEALIKKSK